MINELLKRSVELENTLSKLLAVRAYIETERIKSSRIMCSIAFEHAESAKILVATGNFTSAISLVRLQYEALVRAMWLFFSATDNSIAKLMCELTAESANKANNLPLLSEMLAKLEVKAPKEAFDMLIEFKEYSWKPLSSFVHGGIHAINRHSKGYPPQLLYQLLKNSNGVLIMVGMFLIVMAQDYTQRGTIPAIQREFSDCLPDLKR